MSDVWLDRLWVIIALALLASAASGAAWAVFGDAMRRRRSQWTGNPTPRRCGKCWYDMTGVAGLRCPECGREAKNERGLRRSKRRWGWAAVACVLLLPAHVAWRMPVVRAHGWVRLVPMAVLVSWPMDVGAWAKGRPSDWAGSEILERQKNEPLGWIAARILAERVRVTWRADVAWHLEQDSPSEAAVLMLGSVFRSGPLAGVRKDISWNTESKWRNLQLPVTHAVTTLIDDSSPLEHEMRTWRIVRVGDLVVVESSQPRLSMVRNLFNATDNPPLHDSVREVGDLTFVGVPDGLTVTQGWASLLPEVVCPVARDVFGIKVLTAVSLDRCVVIRGTGDVRQQAQHVVVALRRAAHDSAWTRLDPFMSSCVSGSKPEHVLIVPYSRLMIAWDVFMGDGSDMTKGSLPGVEAADWLVEAMIREPSFVSLYGSVQKRRSESEGGRDWYRGLDEVSVHLVGDIAVLWTTRTDMADMVERALRESETKPAVE